MPPIASAEDDALPEPVLEWCLAQVRGARRVLESERLRGGLSAQTHRIAFETQTGERLELVLRRFPNHADSALDVTREVATLRALEPISRALLTPRYVAHDAAGVATLQPALLITRLDGSADLRPERPRQRLEELAGGLARFHQARPSCPPELLDFTLDLARRARAIPMGIALPDWGRVWQELARHSWPATETGLIHHDFHIGNALFSDERLSGIVDFTAARRGPCEFDVGYCRMDLSMVFGLEAADAFLEAYERARGRSVPVVALWDLVGALRAFPDPEMWLPSWLELGRSDLTAERIRERLAVFVERALRAL